MTQHHNDRAAFEAQIELPPMPRARHTDSGYWREDMSDYARQAIEHYRKSHFLKECAQLEQEWSELRRMREAERQSRGEPVADAIHLLRRAKLILHLVEHDRTSSICTGG